MNERNLEENSILKDKINNGFLKADNNKINNLARKNERLVEIS